MSAYGVNRACDTDFRKKWDKQEYAERAKECDLEKKERMQENEEGTRQGMRPRTPHTLLMYAMPHERNQGGLRRTTS
jgi:hypothetical protein